MLDVAALGELLIDFTCLSTDENGYPTMAAHPGGAPANFLAALAKYGAKTAMLGKVGDDTFGRLLLDTLRRAGIETRGMIAAPDVFTTLAFVTLDARGEREFAFARKPGAGDIFGGSAVWKLLRYGVPPEELGESALRDIVSFACAAAGLSATRPGGISSIPEYDEVLRALKQ